MSHLHLPLVARCLRHKRRLLPRPHLRQLAHVPLHLQRGCTAAAGHDVSRVEPTWCRIEPTLSGIWRMTSPESNPHVAQTPSDRFEIADRDYAWSLVSGKSDASR
eukprot:1399389-Pyramimonas_sp.AAC.2